MAQMRRWMAAAVGRGRAWASVRIMVSSSGATRRRRSRSDRARRSSPATPSARQPASHRRSVRSEGPKRDALRKAGCEKVIVDTIGGATATRPGLDRVRELLRAGDTLVVWRLDRLGRSLKDLIACVARLEEHGVALLSLQETIDTSTPSGHLTFHLLEALAEFERNLIRERTQAGLAAARARGRSGGRPPTLDRDKRDLVVQPYEARTLSVAKTCATMGISKPTLYAYVRAHQAAPAEPSQVKAAATSDLKGALRFRDTCRSQVIVFIDQP